MKGRIGYFAAQAPWIGAWLADRLGRLAQGRVRGPIHLMLAVVDHFEPFWRPPHQAGPVTRKQAIARVEQWVRGYPRMVRGLADGEGHPPKHTFFYPQEEYDPQILEMLAGLCRQGLGEVEVHLHHQDDTPQGLLSTLRSFARTLAGHGLLCKAPGDDRPRFAFIHGNWVLANALDGPFCGVDPELAILTQGGCYADFTMPAAPNPGQTLLINRLFRPAHLGRRRGHLHGLPLKVNMALDGSLIMVPGPLGLDTRRLVRGLPFPRIESGELAGHYLPTPHRADLWVQANVHVLGRPDWVFIKLHCHGTQEQDHPALLGEAAINMHQDLLSRYNDGDRYRLHHVSAREMVNIALAAIEGREGEPGRYRDHWLRFEGAG